MNRLNALDGVFSRSIAEMQSAEKRTSDIGDKMKAHFDLIDDDDLVEAKLLKRFPEFKEMRRLISIAHDLRLRIRETAKKGQIDRIDNMVEALRSFEATFRERCRFLLTWNRWIKNRGDDDAGGVLSGIPPPLPEDPASPPSAPLDRRHEYQPELPGLSLVEEGSRTEVVHTLSA